MAQSPHDHRSPSAHSRGRGAARRPRRRFLAPTLLGTALLLSLTMGAGGARAEGDMQRALCDRYGGEDGCTVKVDSGDSVNLGSSVRARVLGNPNVDVLVRLYLVEFNSDGAITDLIPASPVYETRTMSRGDTGLFELTPFQPRGYPSGGWLFAGLADDTTLDLTKRIGALIQYGGETVRLLGDGYAAQKPIGVPLSMDVIGHRPSIRYWVEYRNDQGSWVALSSPERLDGPPATHRQLTYEVPPTLTIGRSYRFRVNSELNYSGDRLVFDRFVEWTVIPSRTPVTQARANFDPTLAPNWTANPTPGPSPGPQHPPDRDQIPPPGSSSGPNLTSKPDRGRDSTSGAGGASETSAKGGNGQGRSPQPNGGSGTVAAGSASTRTPASTPPRATPPDPPDADAALASKTVWGNEKVTASGSGPSPLASPELSRTLALIGLLLIAAPALWWFLGRRSDRRRVEPSLL